MSNVARLRPRSRHDLTQSLGMIVALASWTMMFGALFFVYVGIRAQSRVWPPPGVPPLPLALPGINTLVLIGSSGALFAGIRALSRGARRQLPLWTALAITLGALFLGLQLVQWRDMWLRGLPPSSGTFATVFYGLTVLHAVHVAAGLIVLFVVLIRGLRGVYTEHNVIRVRVAAMFWHFVDAVWVLMFLALYVI